MLKLGANSAVHLIVFTFVVVLFAPFVSSSQSDTTNFEEVTIRGKHFKAAQKSKIDAAEISHLAPHDLGTLLQFINGLTIKNYGSIGGMKTLSHRGLGGEHTQLVIDGIPINNPQNGQVNLANISPNNLMHVEVSHQNNNELVPVSSLIKSSAVHLKTFDQQFSTSPIALRGSFTLGSFGQKEAFASIKQGGDKYFVSLTGGVRAYTGDYPYQINFGAQEIEAIRRNNALNDYHITLGGGYKWRLKNTHHFITSKIKSSSISQELPGAVILYNNMAEEELTTKNTAAQINYRLVSKQWNFKAFAKYNQRFLHYYEPNALNSDGFIDNQYLTHSASSGFHIRYRLNNFAFHAGNDFLYDHLESSRELGRPTRLSNTSMLKVNYSAKHFIISAGVFSQYFIDQNESQTHRNNYQKIHPQISIFTSDELFTNLQLLAWYKPSSRAPSFNELYYSQVGSKSLKPEESSQVNLGFKYIKPYKKLSLQLMGNAFKNEVKEKILALPTQNLFVWSIQNIGKVKILGGDLNLKLQYDWNKDWETGVQVGASYQYAVDISDKNTPTFNHQIAYTPQWTGNAMLNIRFKLLNIHFSSLYIGERFSLNENIAGNRLSSYLTLDCSASYAFELPKNNTITLQVGVKNLTNASYNFIKYYVMPGRNYFLKIAYGLN
ncbi:hypothetical protein CW751_04395 [Brumimicrobium salinarum]|uniref:TonB-dependent receptor plug domain-containing protein n=1 Tax=Brumimicrobium salinarum TaxID=2058658 RepID=A0A2I0R3Y6_9FLAO|nr:TonB-dependent receptor [Brumimicrobium salinarum]PKR81304.1 hypothetical protein CW751_04395 [Brumimicrobium salinarum]